MTRRVLAGRQATRLADGFAAIDDALTLAGRVLDESELRSTFGRFASDTVPVQRHLVKDHAAQIRRMMREMLLAHGALPPAPSESAREAAREALDRATVAAEELGPSYMRACGPVSDELAGELDRIVSQLLDRIDTVRTFLDYATIERLRGPAESPGGPDHADPLLAELARVVDRYELACLRPPLDALVERFARDDIEIAVFGRVNAGKSSLLNRLIGTPLLPVGSMPMTAVPVYLRGGAEPWGFVDFADGAPQKFALGRLPEFAAERSNARNSRYVTRLRIELPSKALGNSLTLVDVPGAAFDARGGDSSADDVLQRCDVGLVLIDAAAGLTLEEADLVAALDHGGSSALVLVTKADRLDAAERWAVHGFVEREMRAMTGADVPVFLASTVSDDPLLRDDWLERGLRPLIERRATIRSASLASKLASQRARVVKALERRLSLIERSMSAYPTQVAAQLARIRERLEAAQRPFDAHAETRAQIAALVDEVASNAAQLWPRSPTRSLDMTTLVAESLRARARNRARTAEKELAKLTALCRVALGAAATAAGIAHADADSMPEPLPAPAFVAPSLGAIVLRPGFACVGRWCRYWSARRVLTRGPARASLVEALERHFERVNDWRLTELAKLRAGFEDKAEQLRPLHGERERIACARSIREARAIEADLEVLGASECRCPPAARAPCSVGG